jgi:hypothetical protein
MIWQKIDALTAKLQRKKWPSRENAVWGEKAQPVGLSAVTSHKGIFGSSLFSAELAFRSRFPNLMRQTQKVFSRDLAALLKGKSGCRRRRRKALSLILRLTGVTNPKM